MLTIHRKVGEVVKIGDDVEIVIKQIRSNGVRIGIVAPRSTAVMRIDKLTDMMSPLEIIWSDSFSPDGEGWSTLTTNRNYLDVRITGKTCTSGWRIEIATKKDRTFYDFKTLDEMKSFGNEYIEKYDEMKCAERNV